MLVLRDYQLKMMNDTIACLNRHSNPFVVSPTGSGKMIVIAALAKHFGMNVLIVEHRIELIKQAVEKLKFIGENPGKIISGISDPNPNGRIKVGMIQTMNRRGDKLSSWVPEIIIIDEAHLSVANSYLNLVRRFPKAMRVGFSATPWRLDGKGFYDIADEIVYGPSIVELVRKKHLVPTEYIAFDVADFKKCAIVGNEYDQDQVASILGGLTSNIVDEWFDKCRRRSTVVFCANTRHSKQICAEFKKRGVSAEHVDGTTTAAVRDAIIKRVRSGETQVLCNCGVVIEGFDAPILSCVILAIATRSLSKFLQCCGRAMRPHLESGKTNMIVLDFGNCHEIHGVPEDEHPWSLANRKDKRVVEYIEDEVIDFDSINQQVIQEELKKQNHVLYRAGEHDYGGGGYREDSEWNRKYESTGNHTGPRAKKTAQQAVAANPAQPAVNIPMLIMAGAKMPPYWIPANWRDYWFNLERYRLYHKFPPSYSENTARAELLKKK